MLYQAYRDKLAKRKRLFERVWRFRLLILTAILLVLATTAALLGVKGMVYGETVPPTVVYGQPLSATAEAVFGDVEFEYRAVGTEEWTREEPVYAGEYECRAVGVSSAGTDRSGSVYTFRILPLEVEVRVDDTSLIYGETPSFSAALCYGDVLHVGKFSAEKDGAHVMVSADPLSITVTSADGTDVTASYTFVSVEKSVVDIFRDITVETPSATFEYDGTPHGREAEITGLVEGHTATMSLATRTEVGSCANAIEEDSLHILDENGEDVTERYRIHYEIGTLTVTPRPITVRTPSASVEYDGKEHAFGAPELTEGTLAEGQEMEYTLSAPVTAAKSYPNRPNFAILAGEEKVTANYSITWEYGTLEIERRALTVGTGSNGEPFVYDGTPHAVESFEALENTIAEGHSAAIAYPTFTEAGTHTNTPVSFVLSDGEGTDVTENYALTWQPGTVTIAKRPVSVVTGTEMWTYDGTAHRDNGWTYAENYEENGFMAFAEGQTLVIAEEDCPAVLAFDGVAHENKPNRVAVMAGDTEIALENYEITWTYGTLTIGKRPITVAAKSEEFDYDGTEHVYDLETFEREGELAAGQEYRLEFVLTAEDADTYQNNPEIYVYAAGEDVTSNYEITYTPGEITINKLSITVSTKGETRIYDGAEHIYSDLTLEEGALAAGQALVRDDSIAMKGVGERTNEPTYRIRDEAGERDIPKENYIITAAYGALQITPFKLNLSTVSQTFFYDGQEHIYDNIQIPTVHLEEGSSGTELPAGEQFVLSNFLTVKNANGAGERNEPEIAIADAAGNPTTENYDISPLSCGTVIVKKRPITVTTQDCGWVYDGTDHTAEKEVLFGYPEGSLGHTVVPTFTRHVDFSESGQNACTVEIFDGATDVTPNYEITYEPNGIVKITPRPITISTLSTEFVYDGVLYTYDDISADTGLVDSGLALGQWLVRTNEVTAQNAGDYPNIATYEIHGEDGEISKGNYQITEAFGTVIIDKRSVTFGTQSHKARLSDGAQDPEAWVYDGKPHGWEYIELREGTTLAKEQEFTFQRVSDPFTITEVKESAENNNAFTYRVTIKDASGNDVTEKNYEITYSEVYGTLEILPRPVSIVTNTNSWVYDDAEHRENGWTYAENYEENGFMAFADGQTLVIAAEDCPAVYNYDGEKYENRPTAFQIMAEGTEIDPKNYSLTWAYGTVTIEQRPITVTTQSETWVYDATSHTGVTPADITYYEGNDLGHRVEQSFTPHIEVKESKSANECTILIYKGETDVTDNYIITYEYTGVVIIEPRPITVTTQSETWTYDGTSHTGDKGPLYTFYTEDGKSASAEPGKDNLGHTIVPTFTPYTEVADSDKFIECTIEIYDESGNRATDNYKITYNCTGEVTIKKRPLEIYTEKQSFVYDGKEHTYADLGYQKPIPAGQEVVRTQNLTVKDVGEYTNDPHYIIWEEARHREISKDNYDITEDFGTIIIGAFKLNLSTVGETFVYDGEEHIYDHYDHLRAILFGEGSSGTELPAGEKFVLSDILTVQNVNGEGVLNKPTLEDIVDVSGNSTRKNYEIEWKTRGKVVVTPRPLTVTTKDHTWVYDGTSHTGEDDYELEHYMGKPIEKHRIELTFTPYTEVKESNSKIECTVKIFDGETDVTDNYQITCHCDGTVTITPRPVTFGTQSKTWTYDGDAHSWEHIELREETTLADEQAFTFERTSELPTITNVNESPKANEFFYDVTITDANGKDVTRNYSITYSKVWGKLNITKCKVTVDVGDRTTEYDGTEQSGQGEGDGYTVSDGSFATGGGHTHKAEGSFATGTQPGDYTTDPEGSGWKITDENGNDVTDNYDVEWNPGTLHVEKRKIKILSGTNEWEYDGEFHSEPTYKVTEGSLLPEHTVLADYTQIQFVGRNGQGDVTGSPNLMQNVKIVDKAGQDIKETYYDITYDYGTVKITPRPVTFVTIGGTFVYDGQEKRGSSMLKEGSKPLVGDHELHAEFGAYTDVGDYEVIPANVQILTKSVSWGSSNDVTGNYEISWTENARIVITPRPVAVTTDSGSWMYDGTPHTAESWTYSAGYEDEGFMQFAEGQELVIDYTFRTDWGEEENAPLWYRIMAGETEILRDNYKITWTHGTLSIGKRPITVTTQDETWVYDGTSHAGETQAVIGYPAGDLGHRVEQTFTPHIEVMESEKDINECTIEIFDEYGYSVTHNYEITYNYTGDITITPRPVTITTDSVTFVYDGALHIYNTIASSADGLAPGQSLERTNAVEVKNVGDYLNNASYEIYGMSGVVAKENYEITEVFGTITVTQRPVIITTGSETWVYDGAFHSNYGYTVEETQEGRGLVQGHTIEFTPTALLNVTDRETALSVNNEWTGLVISDGADDCTLNYEVSYIYGQLRIKSPVVVLIYSYSKQYDGTPLTYDNTEVNYFVQSLPVDVTAEQVLVVLGGSITEPGALSVEEVYAASTCTVSAEGINRVDFVCDGAPLRITRRRIRIQTVSIVAARNDEGTPLLGTDTSSEAFWVCVGKLVEGHRFADSVTVTGILTAEEDEAKNTLSDVIILDENGRDVTDFYEFMEPKLGTLRWSA